DVAETDGAGQGGRESLEVGDLTGVVGVGELASHDLDRQLERAELHETQEDGDDRGRGHEPDHDDGNRDPGDRKGVEDPPGDPGGEGLEEAVDRVLDGLQWSGLSGRYEEW